MATWAVALVAVAAVALTYLMCVRPMLRGRKHCGMTSASSAALDRQIAELREDLRVLRAGNVLDGDQ